MTSPTVLDPGIRSLSGFFTELGSEEEAAAEEEVGVAEEEKLFAVDDLLFATSS